MTPEQCRAARSLLDWTQPMLAAMSNVGLSSVVDFEKKRRVVAETLVKSMQWSLEAAGIVFIDTDVLGVGLRLRAALTVTEANDNRTPLKPTAGYTPPTTTD